jgi:hypothetical protein
MYDYAVNNGIIDKNEEEAYLLKLGDRQDLRFNFTTMPDDIFQNVLKNELKRCNEILNIGLSDEQLTKTQYYRAAKVKKSE